MQNITLNKDRVIEVVKSKLKKDCQVKVAESTEQKNAIYEFVREDYKSHFKDLPIERADFFNDKCVWLYTEDNESNIQSCVAFSWEQGQIVPRQLSEGHFTDEEISKYIRVGKFFIPYSKSTKLMKSYLNVIVSSAIELGVKGIVGLVKDKDVNLHRRFNAEVVESKTGITYGSDHEFSLLKWDFTLLTPKFFDCFSIDLTDKKAVCYQQSDWDGYSRSFASIQTPVQRELQVASTEHLFGDVADIGCGCAKVGLLLSDNKSITSYTGIDASKEMTALANTLLSQLPSEHEQRVIHSYIEDHTGCLYDSALSLNSYYTWQNPIETLTHIYGLLKTGGTFVLATPNEKLDLLALEADAKKELISHPDYEAFKRFNLKLIHERESNLIEMSALISQLQIIGFKVESCHQDYYGGGLNFLVLKK